MSVDQAPGLRAAAMAGPVGPLRLRHLLPLAALVVGSAVLYVLTVVRSYLANGLDAVSLSEVGGGAYDPSLLPYPPSDTVGLLGWLAIVLLPSAAGTGVLFVTIDVVLSSEGGRWREVRPSLLVLALCVAAMAGYMALGPLTAWWMD